MSWKTKEIIDPRNDLDNRFHADTIEGVNALLAAEGKSTGLRVWANVEKAYIEYYLDGDADLGYAQLASLLDAILAETTEDR